MNAASNGRVLRVALAASLAVHLVVAAIVYSHPVTAAPEQRAHRIEVVRIQLPKPTPPPPKPALPHPQHQSRAVRPAMHPVHLAQNHGEHRGAIVAPPVEPTGEPNPGPVETAGPPEAPTAAPVVVATSTPKPACSAPDVPARAIVTQSPQVPEDDRNGFTGTAKVKVVLDGSGNVVGAQMYESTGSMQLDRAAIAAARESRYAPEERDCKNVGGAYLFTVDFQ